MSLAHEIGLLEAHVAPSRSGPPILTLGQRHLMSGYDPVREATRAAAGITATRCCIVGLGLGYLARALSGRLSRIIAFQGERERYETAQTDGSFRSALAMRIEEYDTIERVERAMVQAALTGEEILFDPSLAAASAVLASLKDLVRTAQREPIAVFIHLRTAGDVLRSLAAVQAFRRTQPARLRIHFITQRPYGALVELAEQIDRVIEWEPGSASLEGHPRPLIAANFGGDHDACSLLRLLRPVWSVGYGESNGAITLQDDRYPDLASGLASVRNRMNRYHLYYAMLGLPASSTPPELKVKRSERGYGVAQFGAGSGAQVWAAKRIDPKTVGEALGRAGGRWIAVGSADEAANARAAGIPDTDNLCGRTTWRELADVIAGARCYVGQDSGPTHLAAALGVPVLALFGFTSPILNAPVGPHVALLQADLACAFHGCRIACAEIECTRRYTPDVIVHALDNLIASDDARRLDTAAAIAAAGFRLVPPGRGIDDNDPWRALLQAEPRTGAPHDPALALTREWLERAERYP